MEGQFLYLHLDRKIFVGRSIYICICGATNLIFAFRLKDICGADNFMSAYKSQDTCGATTSIFAFRLRDICGETSFIFAFRASTSLWVFVTRIWTERSNFLQMKMYYVEKKKPQVEKYQSQRKFARHEQDSFLKAY